MQERTCKALKETCRIVTAIILSSYGDAGREKNHTDASNDTPTRAVLKAPMTAINLIRLLGDNESAQVFDFR